MPFYNPETKEYNGGEQQPGEIEIAIERPSPYHKPVFTAKGKFSKWELDEATVPITKLMSDSIEELPIDIQLQFAAHISLAKHYLLKETGPEYAKVQEILNAIDQNVIPEGFNKISLLQSLIDRELTN